MVPRLSSMGLQAASQAAASFARASGSSLEPMMAFAAAGTSTTVGATPPTVSIPVFDGVMALGTWQSVTLVDPNVDNPIRNMSGGQRQCVSIARTAAFASKLVIMDEPTAALGVQETAQVENIIRGLKDRGIPMILISHNLRQVFDLVDRILVFRRGRIVAPLRKDETQSRMVSKFFVCVVPTTMV